MKITKIEKKKQLYLLEIDADDKLYVTEDTIVHFMLSKNMELDEATLKDIQKFAQFSYGKNLALYHISFKQRTTAEVKKYLEQHDIDSLYIPKILENLKKENWINDEQYVETYLSQNLNTGDKGAYVLKQKLIQKGINSQLIDQKLANLDFSPLSEKVAQKLLRKYQHKLYKELDKQYRKYSKKYDGYELKQRLTQSLARKGFNFDDIASALRDYL